MKYFPIIILFSCLIFTHCSTGDTFTETFEHGSLNWTTNSSSLWNIISIDGENVFHLKEPGKQGIIRAPSSFAILKDINVGSFELSVRAKCLTDTTNKRRDICLFFGYQDSTHFYYAHFSATSDKVHNIIGIVNNSDRAKINQENSGESKALLTHPNWYDLKVVRDVNSGSIKAFVNDNPQPVMTATDRTFINGKIGIGSFDDTAYFDDVKLVIK